MDYERDVETHEDLHHGRTVPIHQIYIQDCRACDPGRKQGQGFLATRGRTDDFAAGVLHGERQVQSNERLILDHSRQTPEMAAELDLSLQQIMGVAIPRNRSAGLTGLLLTIKGSFIQVLEGNVEAVGTTYARTRSS